VFVPACAGQTTGDDVRAKRPPAGDGNGGWKQKGKVPKTLDFIGFSALWMAHPEELESTAYCLGGSRSIPLSYGCMYAVLRSHPRRPKTNTVGLFRRQSLYPTELRVHVCGFEVSPKPPKNE